MKAFPLLQLCLLAAKSRSRNGAQQDGSSSIVLTRPTTTQRSANIVASKKNTKKTHDHVLDWTPPPMQQIRQTRQRILDPMKSLTSSVFYSTDKNGKRHQGLDHVPAQAAGKPMLFVSNHQLLGIDSLLVVNEIHEQRNIFLRSLTHPMVYDYPFSASESTFDGTSFFETYGCLPVSTRNFYRLLQTSQPILLFPGGVQEAFMTSQAEAYTMQGWTADRQDFVRAAAKFNATIVPLSATGAAESAFFWQDVPFLQNMAPSVQTLLQTAAGRRAPLSARYDRLTQSVPIPLVVPKLLPSRHYFLFGPAVDLTTLDPADRDACEEVYRNVKQTIQQGCQDLLAASRSDLFQDPKLRVPYEHVWQRQAPSFSIDLLNQ